MSIYDGVVTLDQENVQVILGVEDDKIRLSSGGFEIGEWAPEDCSIDQAADGVFTISAENETLTFIPNNPMMFTAAMNGDTVPDREPIQEVDDTGEPDRESSQTIDQAEDAKPMTMVLFYALAAITGVLGIWALFSLLI